MLLSDRIVMMTNGPAATVGDIVRVELARPRDRLALANDARYHEYRTAVLEFLYQRQQRPAA
ncbi:Bicarbonate transport ATP-binding protein CmpD [compost metagenome]